MIDKIPKDFRFQRGYPVAQKNEDFHVVVKALPLSPFVNVSVIIRTLIFPKQTRFKNAAKIGFYFLWKAIKELGNLVFAQIQGVAYQVRFDQRRFAFRVNNFDTSCFHNYIFDSIKLPVRILHFP
jgi:hypothetical protein